MAGPENRVVLTDFGLAVVLKDNMPPLTDLSGTPMFWCPEMLGKNCSYGFGCDIFALGLTAYMLLKGTHPFGSLVEMEKWVAGDQPAPLPDKASEPTREMLELALDRDPNDRATAPQLYALVRGHPFLTGAPLEEEADAANACTKSTGLALKALNEMRVGQVNMDEAQLQRREKMIHHLNQEHVKEQKKRTSVVAGKGAVNFQFGPGRPSKKGHVTKTEEAKMKIMAGLSFDVAGDHQARHLYDWWAGKECEEEGLQGAVDADEHLTKRRQSDVSKVARARPEDVAYITSILAHYNVEWLREWEDPNGTMDELAQQCRKGETILAQEEKKLIRVVDVVVPVISHKGHILITKEQKAGKDPVPILPGKKRLAWENRNVTAMRSLALSGFSGDNVSFTEEREILIQKKQSPSCPGILTVYRRHVLHMEIKEKYTAEDKLKQMGWPLGEPLVVQEKADKTLTWTWITKEEFDKAQLLEGDADMAVRYAAVVPAKIHDQMGHNKLREKFRRCGIDPNAFSDEKLEELAKEEESGECTLVEQNMGDGKRTMKRVVKLTIVRVLNKKGDVLVEVGKELRGKMTPHKKMPGIKQRLHENPFLAARRWLTSRLMVDDDEIHFDTKAGGVLEESGDSKGFPGLSSVYEKQVIQVRLTHDKLLLEAPVGGSKKRSGSPRPDENSGFSSSSSENGESKDESSTMV